MVRQQPDENWLGFDAPREVLLYVCINEKELCRCVPVVVIAITLPLLPVE